MRYEDEIWKILEEAVKEGCKLLDRIWPGWAQHVDNMKLDQYSIFNCVLGQLYGSFGNGIVELGIKDADMYGFAADDVADCYEISALTTHNWLTSLWNDEIDYRQEA